MFLLLACAPTPDDWTPTRPTGLWQAEPAAPIPIPIALTDYPFLAEISSHHAQGLTQSRADNGSLGLGNGEIFALIGLDRPWNTLTNLIGPTYQLETGFFGDSSVLLLQSEQLLPIQNEQLQRPRKSAIARTALTTLPATLATTDLAIPGASIILRWITVFAHQDTTSLSLQITLARATDETPEYTETAILQHRGNRTLSIACPQTQASYHDQGISIELPDLQSGEEWSTPCLYVTETPTQPVRIPTDLQSPLAYSYQLSSEFLDQGPLITTPDPKVTDLIEGMLITFYTQTAANGVVSPMNRYTKGWLRDSEGPVRVYTDLGYYAQAERILDATYRTGITEHAINNSFSLDTALGKDPENPDEFWADATFMSGREPVEAPSYPVILHHELAQATGIPWDDARDAYLRACVRRQERAPDGRMVFSGDETFRFTMAMALGDLPENIGYSANTSLLYQAAANAAGVDASPNVMPWYEGNGFVSPLSQFVDDQPWPHPSEDVSLMGEWLGLESSLENLEQVTDWLLRDDGTLLSRDENGNEVLGYTGMVPGYFLNATAYHHSPLEELAFAALDQVATPSGHFEEIHTADHRPLVLSHDPSGMGSDVTARYRPWEGGIVVHALLNYLIKATPRPGAGLVELSPHLPANWPYLEVDGLKMGDSLWGFRLEGAEEGQRFRIWGDGPWLVRVSLHGTKPISSVWVDGEEIAGEGDVVHVLFSLQGEAEVWAVY